MTGTTKTKIEENRKTVLEWFNYRCAMNPALPYDEIHEIIPRSIRPNDWWELDNMIPLSGHWHRKIHQEGTKKYREILQQKLDERRCNNDNKHTG